MPFPQMKCLPAVRFVILSGILACHGTAQTAPSEAKISSSRSVSTLTNRKATLSGKTELRVTGADDPVAGSFFNFTSPDAWLILEKVPASKVIGEMLDRIFVDGEPARLEHNLRVTAYGSGSVVIPQGKQFEAMTIFDAKSLAGSSLGLKCHEKYDDEKLGTMKGVISSFQLKRGYMATIAENEDGTGASKNYVAQDADLEVKSLPPELDNKVRFVRIFPWRWTSKKGIAGGIWKNLNVGWYYDWNISQNSTPDLEYVPIKQKRYWPGLDQDWKARGATHLLGYNEPDRPDQAKMTVDEAIAGWPELLGTGLRLGSPAVSDGGLGWLYDFMKKADVAKLRVDFVAVHYYRAVSDPGDGKAAASQFHSFLNEIHKNTGRPIWVTEWNNGANWTGGKDPDAKEQKKAIAEMIEMLDRTPFVERYALYNWVEDCRALESKDGALTPAGEIYRDKISPLGYRQEKR